MVWLTARVWLENIMRGVACGSFLVYYVYVLQLQRQLDVDVLISGAHS